MKALLYKDFLVLWKQMKFLLIMVAVFCAMPDTGFNLSTFFVAYSGLLIPVTLFAYDERARWDSLAAMLPYSVRDLVLSRYVFAWLATAFALVCYFVGRTVFDGGILRENLLTMGVTVGILLVIQSVYFPILFRLGAEKGRLTLMLLIIGIAVLVALVKGVMEKAPAAPVETVIPVVLAAGLLLCLGSVRVSMKQYARRVW